MTLKQTLTKELMRCIALNLDFAPRVEDLRYSVIAYADALESFGLRDEDAERVVISLRKYGPKAERFPKVKDILESLPPKKKAPALELKISPEQREQNLKRIQEITRKMAKGAGW